MHKVAMTRVVLGPLQWAVRSLRVEASWTPFALVCRWGYPTSGRRVGPDGDPDFGDEPEAGSHKRCDANSSLTFLQKGDRHGRDPKPEHGNRGSQGPSSRERGGVDPSDEVPMSAADIAERRGIPSMPRSRRSSGHAQHSQPPWMESLNSPMNFVGLNPTFTERAVQKQAATPAELA